MGREWLYWMAGTRPRRTSQIKQQRTGCMCAVFHLFHFNLPPSSEVEAPTNSLDLEETRAAEEILNFPVGINQIKTRASTEDLDSPRTTTPNLVARLMGLDLLPQSSSPSSNPNPPTKSQKRCFSDDDISVGARSPRRSDVDHHHRLSLQINNERVSHERRGKQDENNAKQIRVGLLDITNTNRRDQNLPIKLHKKTPKFNAPDFNQSPNLKFFDSTSATYTGIKSSRNSSSSQNKHQPIIQEQHTKSRGAKSRSPDKGMRNNEETFVRSAPNKSPFSTQLQRLHISAPTLLPLNKHPSPPPTKLPLKQVSSSSSDSFLSKRNTQLSCHTSRSYNQLRNLPDKIFTVPQNVLLPDNTNGCAAAPEYKSYVNKILNRAGIVDKFTPLTLGKWHTPTHPLDPSIFYYLELFHPASAGLSRRCNRKLIFQLVDELLADILRPRLDFNPILRNSDHFSLDEELCRRIEGFPAANCKVLEDIDSLVDNDLCKSPLSGCYRAEEERLVCEIEGEIVESLVHETVSLVGVRTDEGRRLHR